jgi:LmbE family N-acetylglucosaminyl deacetylase
MEILITLLIIVIILLVQITVVWIAALMYVNDFTIKNQTKLIHKNVLLVYPHPDDETLSCGGLVYRLKQNNAKVTLLTLTKGEAYSHNPSNEIKIRRSNELLKAVEFLKIDELIHLDLGDGKLFENRNETDASIRQVVDKLQPDLIITFDPSGMYGHPDHVLGCEVVTEICKEKKINLWYNTLPKKLLSKINVPEDIPIHDKFHERQTLPTFRVNVGIVGILRKVKAIYCHESQLPNMKKNLPLKFMPFWFFASMFVNEYFHEELK